jgi:hypothetical protein
MRRGHFGLGLPALVALLSAALLAPLASAKGALWSFALEDTLNAVMADSADGEYIAVTGGGIFDPRAGTAAGGGTFVVHNAYDEPGGPTFSGTWVVTGFNSFTSEGGHGPKAQGGTLSVAISFIFDGGFVLPGGQLTVDSPYARGHFLRNQDAITVQLLPTELFTPPAGGSGGITLFQLLDNG